MLSKKMAVSLMSLITLLALGFVASPALAADPFDVTFEGRESVTYIPQADGKPPNDVTVTVTIKTGLSVADALPTVTAFDKNNVVVANAATIEARNDGDGYVATGTARDYIVKIKELSKVTKVIVLVPELTTNDLTAVSAIGELVDTKLKSYTRVITVGKGAAANTDRPNVVSIQRLRPGSQTVASAFEEAKLAHEPFDVRIVFTELPHEFALAHIKVENGTASNLVVGVPFARETGKTGNGVESTVLPHPSEGKYHHSRDAKDGLAGVAQGVDKVTVPLPTGDDKKYHQYRVTITPHDKTVDFMVKISIKEFHDNASPFPNLYRPFDVANKQNGREQLRLNVVKKPRNLKAGYPVVLPEKIVIPAGGFLVIAKSAGGSEVIMPPGKRDETPKATDRTPAQLLYNVYEAATLPNLATQFLNGVVIDVESQHAGLVISEVMWGEDVSLDPSSNSQYIELYNPGAEYKTVNDADHTPDVNEALTLIFYAPNEFDKVPAKTAAVAATATAAAVPAALPTGVTDRIGTLDATGDYWPPAGKGQSGRSGSTEGELTAGRGAFVPSVAIVSMYRSMVPSTAVGAAVGAMMVDDGQTAANWMTSAGPKSANFNPLAIGVRHGTPGAATDATTTPADTTAEAKAIEDKAAADQKKLDSTGTYPTLGQGRVYISEVMFAGGGVLPQWIEISNGDRVETFNLSGWTLTVANATDDTDVDVGVTATFTIPAGTKIAPSAPHDPSGDNTPSTILVVTEKGRNSFTRAKESAQILNLEEDNEVELILAGVVRGKYTLLSDMAFLITLAPPEPEATTAPAGETAAAKATRQAAEKKAANARKAATDIVGNLGADGAVAWALPMDEGARSSIIRLHVQVARGPAAPEKGTEADNWGLASDTLFAQEVHTYVGNSYYGAANDKGTPGFRAGGALPVELSHFRPARDKVTGTVAITWSTQSELNNAGFFIKRSQQKDGEFQIINATMIQGAGTTSEKQFYTYTDTTAQPNVVYYYQIEDVSLDGNHQTLTRGIRLKGHIGAAGKLTTLWGELKTSNE